MNFVVVVSDTLRRDHVSCYDDQPDRWASGGTWRIETPNIDRLARMGARFDNYFVSSFPTVLNRHEMLTGLPVFTYHEWAPLPPGEVTMGEYLAEAGYKSMLVADTPHIFRQGFNYSRGFSGFDWVRGQENDAVRLDPPDAELEPPFDVAKVRATINSWRNHTRTTLAARQEEDYFAPTTFRRAANWLERNRGNQPFLLVVDTFDPHEPWDPPDWYVEKFYPSIRERMTFPAYDHVSKFLEPEELLSAHAHYCGEVAMVDRWFGRLLDTLGALNLLEDTAVIIVSDHGYLFGEKDIIGKHLGLAGYSEAIPLWPEISHIPMVAYVPGVTRPGGTVEGYAHPQDILPTLLELAGLAIPDELAGHSLVGLMNGSQGQVRPAAISAHSIIAEVAGRPARVTADGWSLYLGGAVTERSPASLYGYGGGTATLRDPWWIPVRERIARQERANDVALTPMLFNDLVDPRHERDLIAENPGHAERLKRLLIEFLVECGTDDVYVAPRRAMPVS